MSFEITTAFVQQFKSNIMMLSQQKGSRLARAVMTEPITGKWGYIEQLGPTQTQKRTTRHGDSPLVSTPHDRRRVVLDSEEWGDLVDHADKVRTLIDPTNPYARNMAWAFGRAKDDHIIKAFFADADTGEDGSTTVSFPAANIVADGGVGLTVAKLISARQLLLEGEVDEDEPFYIAVTAEQISDLLADTEVTSADFNTVKALVKGEIDTYMGFQFIRTQRLQLHPTDSHRRIPVWAKSGMALGVGRDMVSRIAERPDKSFSTYVYGAMDVGATRIEEAKVIEIECVEA